MTVIISGFILLLISMLSLFMAFPKKFDFPIGFSDIYKKFFKKERPKKIKRKPVPNTLQKKNKIYLDDYDLIKTSKIETNTIKQVETNTIKQVETNYHNRARELRVRDRVLDKTYAVKENTQREGNKDLHALVTKRMDEIRLQADEQHVKWGNEQRANRARELQVHDRVLDKAYAAKEKLMVPFLGNIQGLSDQAGFVDSWGDDKCYDTRDNSVKERTLNNQKTYHEQVDTNYHNIDEDYSEFEYIAEYGQMTYINYLSGERVTRSNNPTKFYKIQQWSLYGN